MIRLSRSILAAWTMAAIVTTAQGQRVSLADFTASSATQKSRTLVSLMSSRDGIDAVTLGRYLALAMDDHDAGVRSVAVNTVTVLRAQWYSVRQIKSGLDPPPNDRLGYSAVTDDEATVLAGFEGAVRKLVEDPSPEVRRAALECLHSFRDPSTGSIPDDLVSLARARFAEDEALRVKNAALRLLGASTRSDVTAFLEGLLSDARAFVRAEALQQLGLRQAATAIPRIVELLQADPEANVRWHAAHALTWMWPYSRASLPAVEAQARLESDSRVSEEIARTVLNLRRPFPGEHAHVVDIAFSDLIARHRSTSRLSEAPRDIFATGAADSPGNVQQFDRERLVDAVCRSDVVVRGKIVPGGYFVDTKETFIFGYYTIEVVDVFKGAELDAGGRAVYLRPGGRMSFKGRAVRTEDDSFPPFGPLYYRPQLIFMKRVSGSNVLAAARNFDVITLDDGMARTIQKNVEGGLATGIAVDQVLDWIRSSTCR